MSDKRVNTVLFLCLVFLFVVGKATSAKAGEHEDHPNVLLITIDDQNDWVGYLGGHPQVQTPNIDRLASRGVAFTNAHAQAPLCNPSRTSFLTGLRPSTTGVYGLGPWFREHNKFKDWVTLPQYFLEQGYKTMTTGKVYHGAYPPGKVRGQGIEFSEWGYHGGFYPRPPKPFVPETGHDLVDWGIFPDDDTRQSDWKIADWGMKQLTNPPRDRPFFLSVGFRHPHVPLYTSRKWFERYPMDKLQLPKVRGDDREDIPRFAWYLHWKQPAPRLAWLRMHHEWRRKVRAYLASVSFVDMLVGRLLDTLDEEGLTENTVVVLLSDHGYHLGSKSITGKNTLWHESTRVPFIFAGPGIANDERSDEAVEILDLYPTLVDLCDLPERDQLDGQSLQPLLTNPEKTRDRPAICTHGPNNHAVITEKWRYIRYANGAEELYNRQRDPNEWNNLAYEGKHADVRERLAEHLPDSAPPLSGNNSKTRLIQMIDGTPHWEGKPIDEDAPVPMVPGH